MNGIQPAVINDVRGRLAGGGRMIGPRWLKKDMLVGIGNGGSM